MRLLLVPDPTSPNAQDAFCRELSRRASARGHEARVHAVPNGPLEATIESLSSSGFAQGSDVVLVNSLQPAAIAAARSAGARVVIRFIDSFAGSSDQAVREVAGILGQANLLLVPSVYLQGLVTSWSVPVPTAVVPYAYDQIRAQEITLVTMRASRPTGFALVAAGAFNAATLPCYDVLFTALARLRLDWHLTLIGAGPGRSSLLGRAERLSIMDRISVLEPMPHEKLMEYFRAAKAYVDPCGLEGFPMLALHALSEGCPVIAARRGAFEEIIRDGDNGLLVPPGDAGALSEAIVTLSSVAGLSLRLIAAGIKTVEERSWDNTASKAFEALERLLARPAPGEAGA